MIELFSYEPQSYSPMIVREVLTPETVIALRLLPPQASHGDHGHGEGGHIQGADLSLGLVAQEIFSRLPLMSYCGLVSSRVSEKMKLYRLKGAEGAVPVHMDEDFEERDGHRALYSVLVCLSESFEGGGTFFKGVVAPRLRIGDALIFPHDIPHGGLPVTSGEKIVLKTDLLFS